VPVPVLVPVRGTANDLFEALLVIVKVPWAELLVVGAKLTVNCTDCLTARVIGVFTLLSVNPVPDTLTAETVTDAAPELVIVTVSEFVLLSVTFPKLKVVGLEDNVPCVEETPVPVSGTVSGWTDETVLAKTILLVAVPVAVGEKTAV
jgi:hypothetical protein